MKTMQGGAVALLAVVMAHTAPADVADPQRERFVDAVLDRARTEVLSEIASLCAGKEQAFEEAICYATEFRVAFDCMTQDLSIVLVSLGANCAQAAFDEGDRNFRESEIFSECLGDHGYQRKLAADLGVLYRQCSSSYPRAGD